MKKTAICILSLLLCALCAQTVCAFSHRELAPMLRTIDEAINHSGEYVKKKTDRIAFLQAEYAAAKSLQTRFDLSFQLYNEYLPFVNDSAIHYLNQCIGIAHAMGDESKAGGCKALVALSCSNAGMYVEAMSVINGIDAKKLHGTDLGYYYCARAHACGEIAYYARFDEIRAQYGAEAAKYRKLTIDNLPPDNKNVWQYRESELMNGGRTHESMAVNTAWLHRVKKGSHEYALVTFYRFLEYKLQGDTTQMMKWLGESVVTDIRNGVMDQGSMWEMANQLMVWGDVDRAYRYICFTSDCANRFGSRQRLSRISPLLTTIAQRYKAESEAGDRSLRITAAIISVMALLLAAALFYVGRQRNHLATTRDDLAKSYRSLESLNTQLSALNAQLQGKNAQLSTLNTQLQEANRVKEEYVGRFMRLCSLYIDKLDDLRKKVNKKVKSRQYDELLELTKPGDFKEEEMDELYANFDSAFLHLFPTFVDDFNALLKPENRVTLLEKNRLNTVVRIFALIRLGVTDSSKIAEFLHYSVNTIYNYRAHTKNGALVNRADFENEVKLIGTPDKHGQ